MPRVLSTKILAQNQKELLLNAGMSIVEYDAIKIKFPEFPLEENKIKNAIFSSKNAVKAIEKKALNIENCFCVGTKTSALLREKGFHVKETAENSEKLAQIIVEKYGDEKFIFFCGNNRRDELPEILKKNTVSLKEIEVYNSFQDPWKFESKFDGIMFFSPSAVKSFTRKNELDTTAFCIGETTALEAKKHTDKIIVATSPGIENVIAKLVNYFKNK